ncbi:DNA ligase 4 isoform X2 [Drosophila eugracilis]|uniref:DNA ligase 4 isoform X2 n=1 Tax=Drosophila eugracilis TaxID=29029 RepID=UPI0007E6646D|nr:DNA ligase 4 isoform X2 [Drosophila eugracilis]
MSLDIASTIRFRDICGVLEKVKASKKVASKEAVLRNVYESFCRHRVSFRQESGLTDDQVEDGVSSFYSVLRLLLPGADTGRDSYGLQITTLGKLYINVLQLPKDSHEAIMLQNRTGNTYRDYGDVVNAVLKRRCFNPPSNLRLKYIHELLDTIANEDIEEQASPQEQKWLIRLLLKNLGLGIGEQKIFGVLHPKAQDIYQRCSDLRHVCNLLAGKTTDLEASTSTDKPPAKFVNLNSVIRPFHQIRPMLCERFPGDIEQLMHSDVLYVETKMDGERFQLHIDRGRFMYISRNGMDYTRNFGISYDQGTLTPKLRGLLPLGLESIILDGEMMVWDTNKLCFREKGENTDVKNLKPDGPWQPCFVIYDLLYYNGNSLLDTPYVRRAYRLQKLIVEQPGVLQLMRGRKITSVEEFNELFQQALDSNAEGIVLKKKLSKYQPGVRLGGGWYKDKADYIKGLITEFDVLIIGGFYNHKRTFVESFLLGVLQPVPAGSSNRPEVFSIGVVTNNTKQRGVMNHTLKPHWHDMVKEPPPLWYHYKPEQRSGCPDLWIEPHNSIILQVKAADLTPNGAFFTRKSLHFPRTEMKRDDKPWNECMTLEEFNDLCKGSTGIKKLNKRPLRLEDVTTKRKQMRMTPSERDRPGLAVYEKRCDIDPAASTTKLFEGLSFCILSGSPGRYSKLQLQELAAKNGGSIVDYPLPNDPKCFCVAGTETFLVKRLILQEPRTCDIVRMEWLLRVCEKQELDLRPKDLLSATKPLQDHLAECFDQFGDSYNKDIDSVEELQEILQDIELTPENLAGITASEIHDLEDQLLDGKKYLNLFRGLHAHFYDPHGDELGKLLFLQNGGRLVDEINPQLNLAFINKSNLEDNNLVNKPAGLSADKVINSKWIHESYAAGILLPMQSFV